MASTVKPTGNEQLERPNTIPNELMGQFALKDFEKLARPQEIDPATGQAQYKTFKAHEAVANFRSKQFTSLDTAVKEIIKEHANTDNAGAPLLAQKQALQDTLNGWKSQADVSFNNFMNQAENQLTSIANQQQARNGHLNPNTAYQKLQTLKDEQLQALKNFHAAELQELDTNLNSTAFLTQLQNLGYDATRISQTQASIKQTLQAEHQKREESFTKDFYNKEILKQQTELTSAYNEARMRLWYHRDVYAKLGLQNDKDPYAALERQRQGNVGVVDPVSGKNVEMPEPINGRYPTTISGRWITQMPDGGLVFDVRGLSPEARREYIRNGLLILKMQGYDTISIGGEDRMQGGDRWLQDDIWEEAMLLGMKTNYVPRTSIPAVRDVQEHGGRTRPAHETLRERQLKDQQLKGALEEIDQGGSLSQLDQTTTANSDARQIIRARAQLTEIDNALEQRYLNSIPGATDEQKLIDLTALEEKHTKQFNEMEKLLTDCDTLRNGLKNQHLLGENAAATFEDSTFTRKASTPLSKLAGEVIKVYEVAKDLKWYDFVPFLRSFDKDNKQSARDVTNETIDLAATKQFGTAKEAEPSDMTVEQAQRASKLNKNYKNKDVDQSIEVIYLAHQRLEQQLATETTRLAARRAALANVNLPAAQKAALQAKITTSDNKIQSLQTALRAQQTKMNNLHNTAPNMSDHYSQLSQQPGGTTPSVSL